MKTKRRSSLVVLALVAAAILVAGSVRAVDLGPGDASVTRAAKSPHEQHQGGAGQKDDAPRRGGEHNEHRGGATGTPAPALDNGRYALELAQQVVPTGARRVEFSIVETKSGRPVTRFEEEQTKELHLIVVREDLTGFQHVHPTRDERGRWTTTDAVLDRAGPWRLIADFIPAGGRQTVLAGTVHASGGAYEARELPESERAGEHRWRSRTGPYQVALAAEGFGAGKDGELRFTVSRDGAPVTGLQPYLGALGHAVLLRAGDVAYTHVHPRKSSGRPGAIDFEVTYPGTAPLALFLQFRHRGEVRTVAFDLPAPPR